MTKEKWLATIEMIENKFGIDKNYTASLGQDTPGEKQVVEFQSPSGRIKLEWTEKPRLKNIKTLFANRVGSNVKINREYDENDWVSFLEAFKQNEATKEWEKISFSLD